MYIILLILLFILTWFIARGLFDSKWRANAQEKFDSIKREKTFWYLMNTEDTINDEPGEKNVSGLHVRDVFRLYVSGLARELVVGDFFRRKDSGYNNLDKDIVKQKNHWVDNINLMRKLIDEREKLIENSLDSNKIQLSKSEIQKKFEEIKEESIIFSEEMDKFVALFLRLVEDKNDGVQIWKAIKKFQEISRKYEFDAAGENITNLNTLATIKMDQFHVFEVIVNLLCEKMTDKEKSSNLKKLFDEHEQMEMLQWCMINYSVTWLNTNSIQRFWWRLANGLFLK